MKNTRCSLLLFVMLFAVTAFAVEPKVVVDEDFSLFTAGSEENPDSESITTSDYRVQNQYTKIPNWIGYNVHQAGGVCALLQYIHPQFGKGYGHISTPEMELYGEVTISFRARRAHSNPLAGDLDLALCDNTSGRLETTNITLSNEWKEFSWTTDEAVFNDKCIFQFTPMNGEVLLDDIKVVRTRNKLPKLEAYEPENISLTEFKAKWKESDLSDMKGYYFSVFYKDWPEEMIEPGSFIIDFESINLNNDNVKINTSNPGYPEGWTIDVSSHGTQDVYTSEGNYNSGTKSIKFDAEGDYILTPETPAPINKLSFWVKPSNMETESYKFSLVCVEVKVDDEWTVIANIPNYWMTEGGDYYVMDNEVLGEYVSQIKISCSSMNKVQFAIDDVQIDYATQMVEYPLITNKLVTETQYVVSDIDPTKEHYYYVQQTDGEVVSEKSNVVWVDGILGLAPAVLPATEVSETGFIANWDVLPNAGYYKLYVNQEYEAQADNEEVEILYEDFNTLSQGTTDNPYNPYTNIYNLADNGMTEHDWLMTLPYMANGMAGSQGPSGNTAGLVVSPKLTFGNYPVIVDFTVYNVMKSDVIWVVIMDDYRASNALYGFPIECGRLSTYMTKQVVFNDIDIAGKPVYIAFMSQKGAFFIDEVKISTIVPGRGTTVERPYRLLRTEDNFCKIDRIRKEAPAYNYYVEGHRTKNFIDYVSDTSEKMRVQLYDTGVEGIEQDDNIVYVSNKILHIVLSQAAQIDVYNISGVKVASVMGKQDDNAIELDLGIYIVKVDNKTYKIIIS